MTREAANLTPSHSGWQPEAESEASSRGRRAATVPARARPGLGSVLSFLGPAEIGALATGGRPGGRRAAPSR